MMAASNKVLVTGGAGYIGAHTVVELVQSGYEVVIVDNLMSSDETLLRGLREITGKDIPFHKIDCRDRAALDHVFEQSGPFSTTIHFAALKSVGESVHKPLEYYLNNIDSLLVLLDVMRTRRCNQLVFSSSCTVYGQPDQIPVDEQAPFKKAQSPYGATKQMCERILEDVATTGLNVVSLRYFNPIGAHPSALIGELPIGVPNNLIPFVTQAAAGLRERLVIFGDDYQTPDGTCIRDFIHVVDLAQAHVSALKFLQTHIQAGGAYDAFNLGTGEGTSVLSAVKTFMSVTGQNVPYIIGPRRDGDIEKIYANPQRANNELRWKTERSLGEALKDAWRWQQKLK